MKKRLIALTLALTMLLALPLSVAAEQANWGYLPSPDIGKPRLAPTIYSTFNLPSSVDLMQYVGPIEDQENDPWCVAYGVITAIEAQMRLNGMAIPEGGFSQSWLYTRCKQLDGVPNVRGTYVFTALEIAKNEGLCPESLCPTPPYKNQNDRNLPTLSPVMAAEASKYKITSYQRILDNLGYVDVPEVKGALASGHFVLLATYVEQSWDDLTPGKYGWLLDPWGYIRGGHLTVLGGYDENKEHLGHLGFLGGINSWGEWWGLDGFYEMSNNYANWRDLSVGMPMLLEAYTVELAGQPPNISYINMPTPLQIINPGYTMLPFRVVFEALGGTVDWGWNAQGKIWVRGTIELKHETVTLEMTQGDPVLKVVRR